MNDPKTNKCCYLWLLLARCRTILQMSYKMLDPEFIQAYLTCTFTVIEYKSWS